MKILAWHGDQELRDRIVARMRQHRTADALTRMMFQRLDPGLELGYRGCAIGCLLDPQPPAPIDKPCTCGCGWEPDPDRIHEVLEPFHGWHGEVEAQFGIPRAVALGIDWAFEDFGDDEVAADFAVDVVEAIPVGADLSDVAEWVWDTDRSCPVGFGAQHAAELIDRIATAPAGESDG